MSATRSTMWSRPLTRSDGSPSAVAGLAKMTSSGMTGSFPRLRRLLRRRGVLLGAGGARRLAFLGAQDAVVVGIQLVETLFGGAPGALYRALDILVLGDVATFGRRDVRGCRRRWPRRGLCDRGRRNEQRDKADDKDGAHIGVLRWLRRTERVANLSGGSNACARQSR